MTIMLRISPNNSNVFLEYLGGLYSYLRRQVMLIKPMTIDEACVHNTYYLENMEKKKGKPSGSKKKEHLNTSKEGKKKGKERIRRL